MDSQYRPIATSCSWKVSVACMARQINRIILAKCIYSPSEKLSDFFSMISVAHQRLGKDTKTVIDWSY